MSSTYPYRVYRKASELIASSMVKLGLTPNQITFLRFLICIPSATYLFSTGNYINVLLALIFYHLFIFFDFVDGQVARLKSIQSSFGHWLDGALDRVGTNLLLIGIILGVYNSPPNIWMIGPNPLPTPIIWIVGLLALFALNMCCFFSAEFYHRFNLNAHTIPKLEEKFRSSTQTSKWDNLIKNIITVPSLQLNILFAYAYLITIGGLLNQMFIALLVIAIAHNVRGLIMFYTLVNCFQDNPTRNVFRFIKELTER